MPSVLSRPAGLPVLSEPSQASRDFNASIRPRLSGPFPAHLLSSGKPSSQPPSSIPAPSARIRGCDVASSLERRPRRFAPQGSQSPPGTEEAPTAGGLRVMHYSRVTAKAVTAASAAVSSHPRFRLQELQLPASTSKARPLPACTALSNQRLRSQRLQTLAASLR